jgi:hypothetical protein
MGPLPRLVPAEMPSAPYDEIDTIIRMELTVSAISIIKPLRSFCTKGPSISQDRQATT